MAFWCRKWHSSWFNLTINTQYWIQRSDSRIINYIFSPLRPLETGKSHTALKIFESPRKSANRTASHMCHNIIFFMNMYHWKNCYCEWNWLMQTLYLSTSYLSHISKEATHITRHWDRKNKVVVSLTTSFSKFKMVIFSSLEK